VPNDLSAGGRGVVLSTRRFRLTTSAIETRRSGSPPVAPAATEPHNDLSSKGVEVRATPSYVARSRT